MAEVTTNWETVRFKHANLMDRLHRHRCKLRFNGVRCSRLPHASGEPHELAQGLRWFQPISDTEEEQ